MGTGERCATYLNTRSACCKNSADLQYLLSTNIYYLPAHRVSLLTPLQGAAVLRTGARCTLCSVPVGTLTLHQCWYLPAPGPGSDLAGSQYPGNSAGVRLLLTPDTSSHQQGFLPVWIAKRVSLDRWHPTTIKRSFHMLQE